MDAKGLRIVFMGTPEFAVTPLRRLVEEGYNVVAVVTTPDKPAGRGLKLQESAVKKYALEAGLPLLQPDKLKDPAFVGAFRDLNADLAIVIAFRMLPEVIWAQPRLGTFNLHASLLPQYRGAAPINWAIINGERRTGVTTFMLNHEIDKGAVLGAREVEILREDNAGTLHDKLMFAGTDLVLETVGKIAAGTTNPTGQPDNRPELKPAPKIFKGDCRIDWKRPGEKIYNLIRGLSPYPAAWTTMKKTGADAVPVKVLAARMETANSPVEPGTIVSDGKTSVRVACAGGYIVIDELQMAGKKRMRTEEFLRGFKNIQDYVFD